MSDDLDLRGIDALYEPNPVFRAELHRRVAAIVDGIDPDVVTGDRDMVTMDLEPTSANSAPRRNRRLSAQVILAAAAIVAIALVASREDDSTPADQPAPTETLPPTTPPQALFTAPGDPELLAPGTHFFDDVDGTPTPRIFVTVGAGWSNFVDEGIGKNGPTPTTYSPEDDVGFITFSRPDKVYLDACHSGDGFYPGPVTTVDGLVTALTEQQGGWVDVTAPADISIDGYSGKTFRRTVPAVLSGCPNFPPRHMRLPELDGNGLRSWQNEHDSNSGGDYYEPGQFETLMVLDIDGTVVVINANLWPGSSASDRAEFDDVLASIRIARAMPIRTGPADPLAPGTYFVDEVDGTSTPRIFVTIGTGWTINQGSGIDMHGRPGGDQVDDDVGFITFSRPDQVYLDACHSSEGFNTRHVKTLDGLVAALTEQQGGWVDVTAPSHISIDGYPGKTFQRTAPAVLSNCPNMRPGGMRDPELDGNALRSWLNESDANIAGWYYEPGQQETLIVLDIDGTVVVINANLWAGSSATDRSEFAGALDSIRIDRP